MPAAPTRASDAATSNLLKRCARAATFAHELSQQRRRALTRAAGVAITLSRTGSNSERDVQGCSALLIRSIQLRAVSSQILHDAVESATRGDVHRGLSGRVERVQIDAFVDAHLQRFERRRQRGVR